MNARSKRPLSLAALVAIIVVAAIVALINARSEQDPNAPLPRTPIPRHEGQPPERPAEVEPTVVRDVTIRDLDGDVVYRGEVDLKATLARIDAGERLRFSNDGAIFENRERHLPKQPGGYYREWVHPTPKLSGPGPQRIVTGREQEAWYTPDHYKSFERVR